MRETAEEVNTTERNGNDRYKFWDEIIILHEKFLDRSGFYRLTKIIVAVKNTRTNAKIIQPKTAE
jgi:hypothetical protein